MHSVQTIALQRIDPNHVDLIASETWEQFCRGGTPLLRADLRDNIRGKGRVDLLLMTLRDGVCEEIDAITLALDENGYLMRLDAGMRPLPQVPSLLDARNAFLRRYLKHAHHWRPSDDLINQALAIISRAHTV